MVGSRRSTSSPGALHRTPRGRRDSVRFEVTRPGGAPSNSPRRSLGLSPTALPVTIESRVGVNAGPCTPSEVAPRRRSVTPSMHRNGPPQSPVIGRGEEGDRDEFGEAAMGHHQPAARVRQRSEHLFEIGEERAGLAPSRTFRAQRKRVPVKGEGQPTSALISGPSSSIPDAVPDRGSPSRSPSLPPVGSDSRRPGRTDRLPDRRVSPALYRLPRDAPRACPGRYVAGSRWSS